MSQNLISLTMTDEQVLGLEADVTALESKMSGFIALSTSKRRVAAKMGPKSETFCRQTIGVLQQNPHLIPASLDVSDAQADLRTLDQLRPLFLRLVRLGEKAKDTEFALGSDAMAAALQGYAILRYSGKDQGLEGLRKSLSGRFSKTPRQPEAKVA